MDLKMEMDDELKDAIKEVCAVIAVNMYQATRLTPARDKETMEKAKIGVKEHIKVEDHDENIMVWFDTMGLVTVPPFYGMIPATMMTQTYKKNCDNFFKSSPVLQDRKFTYIF